MEEIEVPLESVQENIHEAAHMAHGHGSNSAGGDWISKIALFSAIVAVLAAITALMAGHHSNEAMITQIKASDAWNFYQAKGIKSALLSTKNELIAQMGKSVPEKDQEKLAEYKKEQDEISEKAKEFQKESENHLTIHQILARSVTMFQVSIAIAAITVLTRRKRFFFVSLATSFFAVLFLIQAFFN